MESYITFPYFYHIIAVPDTITKEYTIQAIKSFAAYLKDNIPSGEPTRVWFIIKHIQKKDEHASSANTIAECLGLSRTQEKAFWKAFAGKKYLACLKKYLPEHETQFIYSEYQGIPYLLYSKWKQQPTNVLNLVEHLQGKIPVAPLEVPVVAPAAPAAPIDPPANVAGAK